MSKLTILIAGGTGFIGHALIYNRLKQGDNVTILGRSIAKIKTLFPNNVSAISWQELNAEKLAQYDVVINLTGANISAGRWSANRKKTIINSRVNSTHKLASLCAELQEKSPRLLNASAIGIYGVRGSAEYDERDLITGQPFKDFLSEVGYLWEQACKPAKLTNLSVVNMRFGVVLDPSGGMLQKLIPVFNFGLGGRVGSGQQILSWISLTDLVAAIDFLISHPKINGPINIVAPESTTQHQFAKQLAAALHRPCLLPLPAFIVKLLYGQMGDELLLNGKKILPTKLLEHGFQFQHRQLTTFFNLTKETIK